jgi:hypothetical protein
VFCSRDDDLVGAVRRGLEGLLDDHVFTSADRDQRRLQMRATRRRDVDHMNVSAGDQVL